MTRGYSIQRADALASFRRTTGRDSTSGRRPRAPRGDSRRVDVLENKWPVVFHRSQGRQGVQKLIAFAPLGRLHLHRPGSPSPRPNNPREGGETRESTAHSRSVCAGALSVESPLTRGRIRLLGGEPAVAEAGNPGLVRGHAPRPTARQHRTSVCTETPSLLQQHSVAGAWPLRVMYRGLFYTSAAIRRSPGAVGSKSNARRNRSSALSAVPGESVHLFLGTERDELPALASMRALHRRVLEG